MLILGRFAIVTYDLKLNKGIQCQLFHLYDLLRRTMIGTALALYNDPVHPIQFPRISYVVALICLSILQINYIICHQPFQQKYLNKLSLFNEIMVYTFSISYLFLLTSTKYDQNDEQNMSHIQIRLE